MMTAKEFATVKRLQGARDGAMRYAHSIKADGARNHYKNPRASIREQVKRARRDNAKLVAVKRVGSTRPVTVVMQAVLPLISSARNAAVQYAHDRIQEVMEALSANDWDLNKVAPYDNSASSWDRMERARKQQRNAKHNFYAKLTDRDGERLLSRRPGEPDIRKMNYSACDRYTRECVEDAEASYITYVFKLDAKVGPCVSAELEGDHVWSHSLLTVVTTAGEEQTWHTQQITNRSILGKYFPQWPTRLCKKGVS